MRSQHVPLSVPLTPEEMWTQGVQSQRGFLSSPGGAVDKVRQQPATIPADAVAGAKGNNVGKGFETFAAIQVVGEDKQRKVFGADFFSGGGLDDHAEAKIVRGLEKSGPDDLTGGRMIVVVEQNCCPSCEARLRAFAQKKGLAEIEIHVPERQSLTNPSKVVTPKTAATTSFKNLPVTTKLKQAKKITFAAASKLAMPQATSKARTAVIGALAGLGSAIALGILQSVMKDAIADSLAKMPKPKADPRTAGAFFSDPTTAKSLRLIDLFGRKLQPFGQELAQHHTSVVAQTNAEIMLLAVAKLSDLERLEFLSGLNDQLNAYTNDLNIVFDNLDAAKNVAAQTIDTAQGAEQLAKAIDNALIADWLLKQGFSFDEILEMHANLRDYAGRVRRVFQDVNTVHAQVEKLLEQANELAHQVNKLYWHISAANIAAELKKRGIEP